MIGEIDTFERLRYPDDLIVRGATVAIGWKRSTDVPRPGSTMPMYRLAIEELDELVIAILDRASLNPRAFRPHTKEATDILLHDNAFADRWRVDE